MKKLKKIAFIGTLVFSLPVIFLGAWVLWLNHEIGQIPSDGWFHPPTAYYSSPLRLFPDQKLSLKDLKFSLNSIGFHQRERGEPVSVSTYMELGRRECLTHIAHGLPPPPSSPGSPERPHHVSERIDKCLLFRTKKGFHLISFQKSSTINQIFSGYRRRNHTSTISTDEPSSPTEKRASGPTPKGTSETLHQKERSSELVTMKIYEKYELEEQTSIRLEGQLFAQFYNGKPILRELLELGEVPLYCLQAATAIEDNRFLDHVGISPSSIVRAALKNLMNLGVVEGASTITQQLVKNYFLTQEKTLTRKFTEIIMAMLLELRLSKDEILQHYFNIIYMGQNGPFEVRGYGSASFHYLGKKIGLLNLPECALLAAIINSPGRLNPWRYPEHTTSRRNRVIKKMLDNQMISKSEAEKAFLFPLPEHKPRNLSQPTPYYLQAVRREMRKLKIDSSNGLKVYTNLEVYAQEMAHRSLQSQLAALEKRLKKESELRKETDKNKGLEREAGRSSDPKKLQALLVSINLKNGEIIAMEGGRGYKQTQYNRALDAHRQVGSLMKAFVYLAALESVDENGNPYTPLSPLEDSPFTHEYEGQTWSPRNYDEDFKGKLPMFYALKNSINVPTARLGLQVGLSSIVDVAKRAGIYSKIEALPSLTLGAFELYPLEVAEAFTTIGRLGKHVPISTIAKVESLNGELLYERKVKSETQFAPETVGVLVGMMQQTLTTGTARSLTQWRGWTYPAAGKTGTTSDTKDAWFVGFTPYILTVVWVGYDDNSSIDLTGASGALPIWFDFMKHYVKAFPADDFKWPEGTMTYTYKGEDLGKFISELAEYEQVPHVLVFRKGNEPQD